MFRVEVLESVDSTNEVIKQAIEEGEPEGFAVRAFRQTGGYGRQGRAWASPKGGMYQSVLLRPAVEARQLPTLALVAALAVRRALAGLVAPECARRIKVKWPNDVVLAYGGEGGAACEEGAARPSASEASAPGTSAGSPSALVPASGASASTSAAAVPAPSAPGATPAPGASASAPFAPASLATPASARLRYAKLCGISSEVHAGGVCIGIGVNVAPPRESEPVGGKNAPAYMSDLGFRCDKGIEAAVNQVGDAVLSELSPLYARWCAEGFSALSGEFAECSMLAGRFVQMANRTGDAVCEGVVAGVDRDGRLLLEGEDGSTIAVSSGEVHLL